MEQAKSNISREWKDQGILPTSRMPAKRGLEAVIGQEAKGQDGKLVSRPIPKVWFTLGGLPVDDFALSAIVHWTMI